MALSKGERRRVADVPEVFGKQSWLKEHKCG